MKGKKHCPPPPPLKVSVLCTGACARTLLRLVPVNRIHSRASSWRSPSVVFGRRRSSTASAIVAPLPVCAPVRVRSGVSAPTEPEDKEEREGRGRVSALPDSGTAVMVMIVRGGAECGFRAAENCGLKGAGWCTSVHVHGESVEPGTVK